MSARAAWRLISLGFRQVFRYTPGKKDWLANGLPAEGEQVDTPTLADAAQTDVPTCGLLETIGDMRARVEPQGADTCVVVNEEQIVLGLLRAEQLEADANATAEQLMINGPQSYRLNAPRERALEYMRREGVESVLVTTTGGRLYGLVRREDLERADL